MPRAGALIAEVGTGEGKSAVIACVAIFCAAFLGKKVHILVDDEVLVARDFETYAPLFNKFETQSGTKVNFAFAGH